MLCKTIKQYASLLSISNLFIFQNLPAITSNCSLLVICILIWICHLYSLFWNLPRSFVANAIEISSQSVVNLRLWLDGRQTKPKDAARRRVQHSLLIRVSSITTGNLTWLLASSNNWPWLDWSRAYSWLLPTTRLDLAAKWLSVESWYDDWLIRLPVML